ncbi:hypothetical protein GXP67_05755 [Rhodocytophaga rosea]|uniref:SRPBCC family protein n=1 Tax=Rhodocytophaga rosea TaxID=2704465 RepID=A0A6C0GE10_9BACT|nr:hypothetical protein [Rhodocytophaga rosea]QHT66206.1 hypothetical protein GXP67_05755 [Rhodocytophaga rosea]
MKSLFAVIVTAVYGLSLRIVYGLLSDVMAIMSLSLLILTPMILGFLTIILISRKNTITGTAAFFLPWLTILVLLIVTMVLQIEGAICWIMIYPMASILAGIGGVIAQSYRNRSTGTAESIQGADKNEFGSLKTSIVLLLPLIIGALEGEYALQSKQIIITKEVVIPVSAKKVWQELININEIKAKEKKASLSGLLGFPKHLRTTLDKAAVGGKRVAYYENGLTFQQQITEFVLEERMVLNLQIDPSKIPSSIMDEHIILGGKHVTIVEDTYRLKRLSDHSSLLTLSSHLIINTPFNWYASLWSHLIMADILNEQLTLIKKRATSNL